jgi:hypothetical protein
VAQAVALSGSDERQAMAARAVAFSQAHRGAAERMAVAIAGLLAAH